MSMFYELMMRKKEEIMYATIKGTLTENDGVFSGFAYNNYLATQEEFDCSKDFEIALKINTGNIQVTDNLKTIARNSFGSSEGRKGFAFGISSVDKKAQAFIFDSSGYQFVNRALGITVFDNYTDYFIKFSQKYNGVAYITKIESSTDGINWITENSWTHNLPIRNSGQGVAFGGGKLSQISQYWAGSIDLNNSYIKIGSTKYNLQAVVGYTIVGSPTITDGVVSGFSTSDYLRTSKLPILSEDFEMQFKIRINNTSTSNTLLGWVSSGYANYFSFSTSGKIQVSFRVSSSVYYNINGNFVFSTNTDYWVKYSKKGNTFYLYYSTDGVNWFLDNSATFEEIISFSVSNYFRIGVNGFNNPSSYFNGSIDLNNTYIKINNKLWFNGQQS